MLTNIASVHYPAVLWEEGAAPALTAILQMNCVVGGKAGTVAQAFQPRMHYALLFSWDTDIIS